MSAENRTLAVIEALYRAALDEQLWPAALRELTALTGSQASSFWVLDGSKEGAPRLPTFTFINFDPAAVREYLESTAQLDPTVRYLAAHPREAIVHDGLLRNSRDEASRAYHDWHERKIETRFRMVGQARLAPGVQAGVALHRTAKAGRYEPRDIERFAVLHSHLERALAIAVRLGSLGAMQQFGAEWLDRTGSAVVLLDEGCRVVFVNRAALQLQAREDGFRLAPAGVELAGRKENAKLQSLIADVISPGGSPGDSAGGFLRASRPSGKRPYGLSVFPASRASSPLSVFRPAVCIVVVDPEEQPPLPVERLESAFGLTRAEARLAAELATGEDLRVVAEKLKITYGTARTRLAQIFEKTGTRRQGELIRLLLLTLPEAGLRPGAAQSARDGKSGS